MWSPPCLSTILGMYVSNIQRIKIVVKKHELMVFMTRTLPFWQLCFVDHSTWWAPLPTLSHRSAYAELQSRVCVYFYILSEIEYSESGWKLVSDLVLRLMLELPFMLPLFPLEKNGLVFSGTFLKCLYDAFVGYLSYNCCSFGREYINFIEIFQFKVTKQPKW